MAHARWSRIRRHEVECLACGTVRLAKGPGSPTLAECPGCGYVGWAFPTDIAAGERQPLHRSLSDEMPPTMKAPPPQHAQDTGPTRSAHDLGPVRDAEEPESAAANRDVPPERTAQRRRGKR